MKEEKKRSKKKLFCILFVFTYVLNNYLRNDEKRVSLLSSD